MKRSNFFPQNFVEEKDKVVMEGRLDYFMCSQSEKNNNIFLEIEIRDNLSDVNFYCRKFLGIEPKGKVSEIIEKINKKIKDNENEINGFIKYSIKKIYENRKEEALEFENLKLKIGKLKARFENYIEYEKC